jgi:hypothetical protein
MKRTRIGRLAIATIATWLTTEYGRCGQPSKLHTARTDAPIVKPGGSGSVTPPGSVLDGADPIEKGNEFDVKGGGGGTDQRETETPSAQKKDGRVRRRGKSWAIKLPPLPCIERGEQQIVSIEEASAWNDSHSGNNSGRAYTIHGGRSKRVATRWHMPKPFCGTSRGETSRNYNLDWEHEDNRRQLAVPNSSSRYGNFDVDEYRNRRQPNVPSRYVAQTVRQQGASNCTTEILLGILSYLIGSCND